MSTSLLFCWSTPATPVHLQIAVAAHTVMAELSGRTCNVKAFTIQCFTGYVFWSMSQGILKLPPVCLTGQRYASG